MNIIFKSDENIFFIEKDELKYTPGISLSGVHLDMVEILYNYVNNTNSDILPVYYEHNGKFITKNFQGYTIFWCMDHYIKDYSLVNLKLLEDENII